MGKMKKKNNIKQGEKSSEKLEDMLDVIVATARKEEPKRDWVEFKKSLKNKGKL